jgi:hypothetical protein
VWAGAVVVIIGVGALMYFNPQRSSTGTTAPELSTDSGDPPAGVSPTSGLKATPAGSDEGFAASAVQFVWPGGDCWDIFRGEQLVTFNCGSTKQALAAGTYTIKPKHAPVFTPFQVEIKTGAATRIEKGGTFIFKWPGGDCWDIFRGSEEVTHHCGSNKQALEAGHYTIKPKAVAAFAPFEIDIKNGAPTQVQKGGTFVFNWPGGDCWDILRGTELVTHHCGSDKQALEAGTYLIKAKHAPVFEPFRIKVTDGAQVKAP